MVSLLQYNTNGDTKNSSIEYKWCDFFDRIQMVTLQIFNGIQMVSIKTIQYNTNGVTSSIEYKQLHCKFSNS